MWEIILLPLPRLRAFRVQQLKNRQQDYLKQLISPKSTNKGCFQKIASMFKPTNQSLHKTMLQEQLELFKLCIKCTDYVSIHELYIQTVRSTRLFPLNLLKQDKTILSLQKELQNIYFSISQIMLTSFDIWQYLERIRQLQKLATDYSNPPSPSNDKIIRILESQLSLMRLIYKENKAQQMHEEIYKTFQRLYDLSPQEKKIGVWNQLINIENQTGPNTNGLLQFRNKNYPDLVFEKALVLIGQSGQEQIKKEMAQLKVANYNAYKEISQIMVMVNLGRTDHIQAKISNPQTTLFKKIHLQILLQMNQTRFKLMNLQDQIRNNEKMIEQYKQDQWEACLQIAYLNLIKLKLRKFILEGSAEKQGKRQMFRIYEQYIQEFRKKKDNKKMLLAWNQFVQGEIFNSNPNLVFIQSIIRKYFELDYGYGLILLFLKRNEQVDNLLRYWRIQEKHEAFNHLSALISLLESSDLKKLMLNWTNTGILILKNLLAGISPWRKRYCINRDMTSYTETLRTQRKMAVSLS